MGEPRPAFTPGMGELAAVEGAQVQAPFGHALAELADSRPEIVALTADMAKYTDLLPFANRHPDRYWNVGMAEQNLVAVAAGLAKVGKIVFITTYGVFLTRRALDFIVIACAHSKAEVKIFANMPGLANGLGGTHQSTDDVAIMRTVPGLTIIDPADATELVQVVRACADIPGTVFVRNIRGNVPILLDAERHRFELGTPVELRAGHDVGVISTGIMSGRALQLLEEEKSAGVSPAILHVATLKPFPEEAVAAFAARFQRLVVAENHIAHGGLGSLVIEALYRRGIVRPLVHVALEDRFHECGPQDYLERIHRFDRARLREAILQGI
jgi:transketolase